VIKAVAKADAEERAFWSRTIEKGQQGVGDLDHALELLHRHGALEETRRDAIAWADKAKAALAPLPDHGLRDILIDLADYVVERIN
jgi:octaprenyl-diphosphate synthase